MPSAIAYLRILYNFGGITVKSLAFRRRRTYNPANRAARVKASTPQLAPISRSLPGAALGIAKNIRLSGLDRVLRLQ
jgi:hypothetical protein